MAQTKTKVSMVAGAVADTRQVSTGAGLSGGGNLQADRTLIAAPHTAEFGPFTNLASASTCDLSSVASVGVNITGTTTITSFGSGSKLLRMVKFAGALTLTHNATSLILPGGASITTAAGDTGVFLSDGSGNWTCVAYSRASGKAITTSVTSSDISASVLSALAFGPFTNLASATTCDIGGVATIGVNITGTTTITSFGTGANRLRIIKFAAILTLTHNATTLILPGGANIATAAGDTAIALSDGSGNWTVVSYQRAASGSLASLLAGTSANNLVQLDGSAKLPAIDGSQLTGISTGGMTLIGTLTTTSGTTQSLTSISSTYKSLMCVLKGVSMSGSFTLAVFLSTDNGSTYSGSINYIAPAATSAASTVSGVVFIDLSGLSGVMKVIRPVTRESGAGTTYLTSGVDNAVTGIVNAIRFMHDGAGLSFDAGSIDVYGIK